MKLFKKLLALASAAVMVAAVAGCHPKDEVAVTVGDIEFTSAYYMCALIHADTEARSLVDEALAAEEEDSEDTTTTTEEVDYYSEKVEDTDFVKWVKNRAIESLKQIAAYKIKCREAGIELDEETADMAEQYAAYYWSSYGYSSVFEPNGVSEATYTTYMKDSYYSSLYFEHLYSAGGEKEIAAADVSKQMTDNFVVANVLEADLSSLEDADKTATTAKFNEYLTALQNGSRTFEDIYKEYNNVTDEEETADTENTEEDASEPQDAYASILGTEETNYASDNYETAKAMAVGEIKLITAEDGSSLTIIVKKDISADPYYLESLDLTLRDMLKGEEYAADMEAYAADLKEDVNDYAVDNFKVKKIVYPETSN